MHEHAHAAVREASLRALTLAVGVTGTLLLVQLAGGVLAGSLALLADAAHVGADLFALVLSWTAARLAIRPSTPRRSYGLYRVEILATLANCTLLLVLSGFILWESIDRLRHPRPVAAGWMAGAAAIALAGNLVSLHALKRPGERSLNVKAAYLEVLSDTLGAVGVLVAALVVLPTGWTVVDPVLSAILSVAIVPRTIVLGRDALHILLEGTPPGLEHDAIEEAIRSVPGVSSVHDLHVWCLTSGVPILTAHVVGAEAGCDDLLERISACLKADFGIEHSTIQIEHVGRLPKEDARF